MLNKLFKRNRKANKSRRDSSLDSMKDQFAMSTKAKILPPRFAEQLLFLEMEMEQETIDLTYVKRLLELYAISCIDNESILLNKYYSNYYQSAVEYYESIQSDKYFIFKNKTQSLLLKPNVSSAMLREQMQNKTYQKSKTPVAASAKEIKFDEEFNQEKVVGTKKEQVFLQLQQKEHHLKVQYINAQDSQENAKILLCQHQQEQNYTKNIIDGQIKNQKNDVLKRLEQRRKSKLDKSVIEQNSQTIEREINDSMKCENSFEEKKLQYEQAVNEQENKDQINSILEQLRLQVKQQSPQTLTINPNQKQEFEDQSTASSSQNDKKNYENIFQENNVSPFKEQIDIEKYKKTDQSSTKKRQNQTRQKYQNEEYKTPNKENNIKISKQQIFDKIKINGFSNSSNYNSCDSPVLIKMNSYAKNNNAQVNVKWMTASTNNFHTPFQFD